MPACLAPHCCPRPLNPIYVMSRDAFINFAALILAVLPCAVAPRAQTPPEPAQLRLPHMLSDHAVLQRERPIHIWGWDAPGTAVKVEFRHQHMSTHADEVGAWSLYLNPEPAGGPDELVVQGSSTITLSDILVGDVWF